MKEKRKRAKQCCRFSRNTAEVTPKNVYFLLSKSILVGSKYPKIKWFDFEKNFTGAKIRGPYLFATWLTYYDHKVQARLWPYHGWAMTLFGRKDQSLMDLQFGPIWLLPTQTVWPSISKETCKSRAKELQGMDVSGMKPNKGLTTELYVLCTSCRHGAAHAPVRGHLGWCWGLESSESWVINESLPMTGITALFR